MTDGPFAETKELLAAVAMADGPAAGLRLVDALLEEPALRDYHLLPGVRAAACGGGKE